jgi:hypothetical protein
MSTSMALPPFDAAKATTAVSTLPGYVWNNLVDVFAYGACDLFATYVHGMWEQAGYKGPLPMLLASGIGETMKFGYYTNVHP